MTTQAGPRGAGPEGTLEVRVRALEERVTVLGEALRVLAHGLEDVPVAEQREGRAAEAARRAHELLLAAPGDEPAGPPEDRRSGALPARLPATTPWQVFGCCFSPAAT